MTFAPIFARLIELPVPLITLGRMGLGAPCLLLLLVLGRKRGIMQITQSRRDFAMAILTGLLLTGHWCAFFQAVKTSTVAVALIVGYTYPIMITILEPVLYKERFRSTDLLLSIVAFIGIAIMIEDFSFQNSYFVGAVWSLIGGLCFGLRQVFSRSIVRTYGGGSIMFWQLLIGAIVLSPLTWMIDAKPTGSDWLYLLLLASIATAAGHTLVLGSLKNLSAKTTALISTIQPLYGILLAIAILKEFPSARELLGGAIVISVVLVEVMKQQRRPS